MTTLTGTSNPTSRWDRRAPWTGVAFVVLLVVSAGLPGATPKTSASGATVIHYAHAHQGSLRLSGVLITISLLVGLLFFAQLREHVGRDGGEPLATVSYGGAVLFAAGGGLAAGLSFTMADITSKIDPGAAQAINLVNRDLALATLAGVGIMMFGAGWAALRSKRLPTWLAWAGVVAGLVSTAPIGFPALALGGLWILAASITMSM